ncbi:MAG: glycine--tRNA ligase [Thermomicrobiales bacterium]
MDTIVSLSKRRGFVFQGSEMYGGLANTWDFGPLGVEIRRNIKDLWWNRFVHQRSDIVGMDGSILMNPRVWEVSGHVSEFNDPEVDCRVCQSRFRADSLIEDATGVQADGLPIEQLNALIAENEIKCPTCGNFDWTPTRRFNLMFQTQIGPVDESSNAVYLRPETAQSIFMQYRNIQLSSRQKIPFGIAQIGKAFRNEVTPGNFIFRLLEFEMMEIEYFIDASDWEPVFEQWLADQQSFVRSLGISDENVRAREHTAEELSHYSKRTADLEYHFPFGWKELTGLAYREDYDLRKHQEGSGANLTYFDQANDRHFIPHVVEPTFGVDRLLLMVLIEAFTEEETVDANGKPSSRTVMRFAPDVAPYKVAVLPLSRKPELADVARDVFEQVQEKYVAEYDETQNIGRRYRRQDEIGTPLCVTVDFETLEDRAVTIRDRDTMDQVRVPIDELLPTIDEQLSKITARMLG